MTAVVIDTNVAVVANGNHEDAGETCRLVCIQRIRDVLQNGVLVLDTLDRIFDEYRRNLRLSGQPGVGDMFMKWVNDNRFNTAFCERVAITPREGEEDYLEFPNNRELSRFDRSDRKFVAVALASRQRPSIVNAADRGWWRFRRELEGIGITVEFLCPSLFV